MQLFQLAEILNAQTNKELAAFSSVSIDTRSICQEELFFALSGPNFDGHDYLFDAKKKKASAAVVERWVDIDIPQIKVECTREALSHFAGWHRQQYEPLTVAVTGSCGKTTTRSFLENIFKQNMSVLATQGNYNNDLGVPLMLLKLTAEHQALVLELGANHLQEIRQLADLVKPDIAIVTNANAAHTEGFGSLDNVAQAKAEIWQSLSAEGTAIINRDDNFFDDWFKQTSHHRQCTFGLTSQADVWAEVRSNCVSPIPEWVLHIGGESIPIKLQLLGKHNVMNALAAAAAAHVAGIDILAIQRGLQQTKPVANRMIPYVGFSGATIIDDTYNASPEAVKAAIRSLQTFNGETILVLGDMLELGNCSVKYHREVGEYALKMGVNCLYTYGELTKETQRGFGQSAFHFETYPELIASIQKQLNSNSVVLIKGSHSMNMGSIVQQLME